MFNMCNGTADYPVETIKKMIEKSRFIPNDFGEIVAPAITSSYKHNDEFLKNMCETSPITMYPQSALNMFQEMTTVVNVEGYKQAVKFEACV